jgi:DNA polymerase I-like protein with 3'-5' exonuclease and polymerase domains
MSLPIGKWSKGMGYVMDDGSTISDHLISIGISSYQTFEQYIQEIEKDFWYKRFPVYAKWKEKHYSKYLLSGEVQMHTGFICSGAMSKNDVINYPVQGAAFHCLLWTLIQMTKRLEELEMDSKIVGQIHDSLIIDVHPDEVRDVYELVRKIGIDSLKENFPWINVPIEMEAEICPVDGSWADKEDFI